MRLRGLIAGAAILAALAGCGDTNVYVGGDGAGPDRPGPGPAPDPDPTPDPGPDPTPDPDPAPDPGPGPGPTPDPGPTPGPDDPLAADLLDIAGDFGAMGGRADALDATAAADMPVSGAATYKGAAEMTVGTGPGAAVLFGETRIRADFDDGTVSGGIDNVIGQVGGGRVQEFEGSIDIDEWLADPGSPATGALASGELTSGATVITIDATLEGGFLGQDATTIGLSSGPGDATGSIDGVAVTAEIALWGEQVWRGP